MYTILFFIEQFEQLQSPPSPSYTKEEFRKMAERQKEIFAIRKETDPLLNCFN